jgi:transcriptional regulator with XRE-family HTH domain
MVKKLPDPIDRHVGGRVRMRRLLLKMSQEKLGEALGLTFQQVQKYEKGMNRIGASRLQQIAKILNVAPAYFFDGAPAATVNQPAGFEEEASSSYVADFISTAEGLHLIKAFTRIGNARVRKRILDLVVAFADAEENKPAPEADARQED